MTLGEFFRTLKTKDIKIIIMNNEENEIIKFYSDGYDGVESDIRDKEVTKWFIISPSSIKVYIDDTNNSNPSNDNTSTDPTTIGTSTGTSIP